MNRLALLSALWITPALAGVPSVPHSLRPYLDCMHQVSGLPIPATLPTVIYSDEWSKVSSPNGDCCDVYGQRVFNGNSYSSYDPAIRVITVYRSARPSALVHELAADAYVKSTRNWNPQARERVGYDAEGRANIECEGLE